MTDRLRVSRRAAVTAFVALTISGCGGGSSGSSGSPPAPAPAPKPTPEQAHDPTDSASAGAEDGTSDAAKLGDAPPGESGGSGNARAPADADVANVERHRAALAALAPAAFVDPARAGVCPGGNNGVGLADGGTIGPADRAACINEAQVRADVAAVAILRPPHSEGWRTVQALCEGTLREAGYEVQLQTFSLKFDGEPTEVVNVIGRKPGKDPNAAAVVVGAHYDHIEGCHGADDNASGVAIVLGLARATATLEPERPLVVACWDQEESGLHGSAAHSLALVNEASPVALALVLDAVGVRKTEDQTQRVPPGFEMLFPKAFAELDRRGRRGDFVAILADPGAEAAANAFAAQVDAHGVPGFPLVLPQALIGSPLAADLHRSDHANFWAAGIPALMLTDTADFRTETYHCFGAPDDADTVDPAFITAVARATTYVAVALVSARGG